MGARNVVVIASLVRSDGFRLIRYEIPRVEASSVGESHCEVNNGSSEQSRNTIGRERDCPPLCRIIRHAEVFANDFVRTESPEEPEHHPGERNDPKNESIYFYVHLSRIFISLL